MSANNNIQKENLFQSAVYAIFYNWTSFQLVLDNNFGGADTKEKADWLINATYEWIIDNNGLDDDELEEFFLDTMNTEFNTLVEDDSALEVARHLVKCFDLYKNKNNHPQLESEINKLSEKFSNNKKNSIKMTPDEDETSSEDEEDEKDENNNESTQKEEDMELTEAMESVEDGWSLVWKGGKHVTK